jgi:signal transduction histidine kinase
VSQSSGRIRSILGVLAGVSLVLSVALLWEQDRGTLTQARALSERLDRADRERLETLAAEESQKTLQPLASLADGKRGEFIASVQQGADNPAVKAWAAGPAAAPKKGKKAVAKAPDPKAALAALVQPMHGVWSSATLLDKNGKVAAAWADAGAGPAPELGKDLSKQAVFVELSSPNSAPGIPSYNFEKVNLAAPVQTPPPATPLKGKDGKPLPPAKPLPPKVKSIALMVVGCGVEGPDGNFAGLLLASGPAQKALLGEGAFDAILQHGPKAAGLLVRGNGDELYHTAKEPYSENLGAISADYKALLAAMVKNSTGRVSVASYDGIGGVFAWQRVGAVGEGAAPQSVLSVAAFIPATGLKAGAGTEVDSPKPFYQRPWVLLLLLLAVGGPLVLGWLLLPGALAPYQRTATQARRVEEYSPIPDLMLADEPDDDARLTNKALDTLSRRGAQAEERVRELDAALRRVEEQAGRDATQAAVELSQVREKIGSAEQGKLASDAKFEAAQKARQDIESQLGNLKSALEAASRNTDLKVAENKNLSAQVQDLMRALEEQRKVAEKAQEGLARKEGEVVRLAAVNTLSSELKATLTVIKNYISTMLGSQGAISDAQQEFLGVVINKSARLERLINDLVELSEIGSGVKPLNLESITPGALVQEALVNARPQAEHKKISLEFAESGNLSVVHVDKEKIGGVLRSLLSQAIKVTSRSEKIVLLLSERENSIELRVTDPGMSLPPDRAAKVFAQFHGVDSQAGPEFIGTGLRFPILRSVIEAHGGKIWIESQVGRGKTFVVALPKAHGAPLVSAPAPVPSALPASMAPSAPLAAPMPPPGLAVKPLPPPPTAALPSPPPPTALPKVAPLAPPPIVMPEAPSKPAPAPVFVPKPAPVDEALTAPWKRHETKADEELDDMMELPPMPSKPAVVAPLPSLPPIVAPAGPAPLAAGLGLPPLGPPPGSAGPAPAPPVTLSPVVLKTAATPSAADAADFDKIFGAPPPQAIELKGGAPKVELKTAATPSDQDMAQFAALFGGNPPPKGPPPPPPPGMAAPGGPPAPPPGLGAPKAPSTSDFDALFGAPAKPGPPPPGLGAPAGPPAGAPPPPPPPGLGAPKPPSAADFDALFGAPSPPAPPAGMPSPPPPKAAPASSPPPPPAGGGLNTLDDLSNLLGA